MIDEVVLFMLDGQALTLKKDTLGRFLKSTFPTYSNSRVYLAKELHIDKKRKVLYNIDVYNIVYEDGLEFMNFIGKMSVNEEWFRK